MSRVPVSEPFCMLCGEHRITEPRRHEGHFSVRFGDQNDPNLTVLLDGEEHLDAYEVLAGNPGLIAQGAYRSGRVQGRAAVCSNCRHPLVEYVIGDVRITNGGSDHEAA